MIAKRTIFAKRLRKSMTEAEKKLWYKIRKKQLGVKFRRQQPIGGYVVDFVCFDKKVIIEIDGG
jgi:very-short-patch-repair endonuclease